MRLNVDSLFLRDPRVKRLAMLVKRHERHVRGDLLEIWEVCFLRRSAVLEALDIDAQGELEGYAAAMVRAGLATDSPDGIRIHGVEERLRWLVAQDAKRAKANNARNGKKDDKTPPRGHPQEDARDSRGDVPSEIWDLRSEIRDLESQKESGAFAPPRAEGKPAEQPKKRKHDWLTTELRTDAERVWSAQESLRASTIPNSRPLAATDARIRRVAKILLTASVPDCLAVLERVADRCRRDPDQRQWFNGETTWRQANFDRELGQVGTPAADPSRQQRAGPFDQVRRRSTPL